MFRLSSIRAKLYALIPATLLAVGVALGLGFYVQHTYGIGGPVYERMYDCKSERVAIVPRLRGSI